MRAAIGWVLAAMALGAGPAEAQLFGEQDGRYRGAHQLAIGGGPWDFRDNIEQDEATEIRLDFRPDWVLLPQIEEYALSRPWFGLNVTTDGGLFAGGGFRLDIPIYQGLVLTPSTGVGFWSNGDGKDLGFPIQFRSMAELGYQFEGGVRVSAYISHVSNANLGDDNPGADAYGAYLAVPLGRTVGDWWPFGH